MDLGLMCRNYAQNYSLGRLILPAPFVLEYGSSMGSKLSLEVPSGEIWFGKYVSGKFYVEGLEDMMLFYGIRPYHMVALRYLGGSDFKIQIFNECAVEISYPFSCPTPNRFKVKRNDPFAVVGNLILTEVEIDKLASTCSFNMLENFNGFYELVINKEHLNPTNCYEIMSVRKFRKFCVNDNMRKLDIGFEHSQWTVSLGTKNEQLTFDKGWYEFVKAAKICEGDLCVFIRTADPEFFKIAVIPKILLTQWTSTCDARVADQRFSWIKKLKGSILDTGKLEVPKLFAMRFGNELSRKITFRLADGRVFYAKYKKSKHAIYGLECLIDAYDIYHNCLILFEYIGHSEFKVSIFDSLNMDHLKEVTGEFIADIIREIKNEEGSGNEGANQIERINVEEVDMVDAEGSSENDTETEGNAQIFDTNDEAPMEAEDNNTFTTTLKRSHLDKKGRGVYCKTCCYEYYKNWKSGTAVTLCYQDKQFKVEIQRSERSCRFGKGWDRFVTQSQLKEGDNLEFRFNLEYNLDVVKLI